MKKMFLERPVQYSASATKVSHFSFPSCHRCFRLHWHDRMEFLRIRSGKLFVEYETKTVELSAGELMMISPKALHTGYTKAESVEYDVLIFDVRSFYNETEVCKNLLPAIFDGRAVFRGITSDEETVRCFDEIHSDTTDMPLFQTAKIYQLIAHFYQKHLLELRSQPKNASVRKIVDYLEKNYAQDIDTAHLCETFGYSAAHLCRKFKQATGLTPMTYLKIFRLETARRKLKNRDISIGEIASVCGFPDANYFTRCFKAHFGVAPTQYEAERR